MTDQRGHRAAAGNAGHKPEPTPIPHTEPEPTGAPRRRRWPHRVFGVGAEPDPRFTFANERTFLAWIRTSLALIAAGISLDTFVTKFPADLRTVISIALVLAGSTCGAAAYRRWMSNERALRLNRPLPAPTIAPALAYGAALIGLVITSVLLLR